MSLIPPSHQHLAQLFGLIDLGNGAYALAQMYYCGGSVIELVKPKQGLDLKAAARYMKQVGSFIAATWYLRCLDMCACLKLNGIEM